MRVALCFSGIMRDLDETKNFWTDLIKKYNIDVYASFWDIENEELGDTIENFQKVYTVKKLEIENYKIFKQTTQSIASLMITPPNTLSPYMQKNVRDFGQLSMYYKVWKANQLSKILGIEYDIVIRARIDTVLDDQFEIFQNDMLNVPMGVNLLYNWPGSEGINDCFAYANPKIMDYYSFIYLQLLQYHNEGHYIFPPEHLLAVHFSKIKIQIRFFPNYMMISRNSKGLKHEIYNRFMKEPRESVYWSDYIDFKPNLDINFKNNIKDIF
jgi:hypothetical protein